MDVADSFGPGYIGSMVTMGMYGLTTLQTYFYYVTYPEDGWGNKLLVAVVFLLDTLHVIFMNHAMYWYLVSNYGNPETLDLTVWSLIASIAMNVLVGVLAQSFFTRRIALLIERPRLKFWLTSFIGFLVFLHLGFGVSLVVFTTLTGRYSRLPEITLYSATPLAISVVLSDLFIAVTLCVLLHGSRTGYTRTNALLSTLIIYAINRCLLTSVVAVAECIAFVTAPHSLWYLAIDFVVGKLYANSLLAALNSRVMLRDKDRAAETTGIFGMNSVHLGSTTIDDVETRGESTDIELDTQTKKRLFGQKPAGSPLVVDDSDGDVYGNHASAKALEGNAI